MSLNCGFLQEKRPPGSGEVMQTEKCLLHKHQGLRAIARAQARKLGTESSLKSRRGGWGDNRKTLDSVPSRSRLCAQLQAKERVTPSLNPRQTVPEEEHLKFTCSVASMHICTPAHLNPCRLTHTLQRQQQALSFPFHSWVLLSIAESFLFRMCSWMGRGGLSRPQVTDSSAMMVSTSLVPARLPEEAGPFDRIPL